MNDNVRTSPTEDHPDPAIAHLIQQVVDLKEDMCLDLLRRLLDQGYSPARLLAAFTEGTRRVGVMFEKGEYFIAALIMAGTIMQEATDILTPHLYGNHGRPHSGTVLLATIRSDIHDLGKNLFALLLRANGFEVEDIGVDVDPDIIVNKVESLRPDLVGISCTLTGGLKYLKQAVEMLHERLSGTCPPIIIGGVCVDMHSAKHVGADYWAQDAASGVMICRMAMSQHNRNH